MSAHPSAADTFSELTALQRAMQDSQRTSPKFLQGVLVFGALLVLGALFGLVSVTARFTEMSSKTQSDVIEIRRLLDTNQVQISNLTTSLREIRAFSPEEFAAAISPLTLRVSEQQAEIGAVNYKLEAIFPLLKDRKGN